MELLWRSKRESWSNRKREKHYSENCTSVLTKSPLMYVLEKLNWVPWDLDGSISPSLTSWEKIQMLLLLSPLYVPCAFPCSPGH